MSQPVAVRVAAVCLMVGLALVRFGLTAHGAVAAFVSGVLVVLAAIDIERRILPNRIVLPATAIVLVVQVTAFPERAAEWVIASAGAAVFLFAVRALNPAGLGLGDVKLALLLGAALGAAVVPALAIGALAAGFVGVVLIARYGSTALKTSLPFGPFLAAGALITLFIA